MGGGDLGQVVGALGDSSFALVMFEGADLLLEAEAVVIPEVAVLLVHIGRDADLGDGQIVVEGIKVEVLGQERFLVVGGKE